MDDLDLLAMSFDKLVQDAPRQMGRALGKGADVIRDEARKNVSQNMSPRFADAIISRREARGDPAAYVLLQGIPGQEDAPAAINAWEVGTARHGPKPSITPAVEKNVDGILGDLSKIDLP